MKNEENITALQAWCSSLLVPLFLKIYWNGEDAKRDRWQVAVKIPHQPQTSLRTLSGNNLDEVCAELLPKAQAVYEQGKAKFESRYKKDCKDHNRNVRRDFSEIEAMHRTAGDY